MSKSSAELLIVSGRSGSGKSTALHQLEDDGYYCIDNLPAALLPALVQETARAEFGQFKGTAVCIDARNAWKDLENFNATLERIPSSVHSRVLFLDADDDTLIKRFSETRRRHPLSGTSLPLTEALSRERDILSTLASNASLTIDTSQMTIYELRDTIKQRLLGNETGTLSILVQSFGFKRGLPVDADLVFDVRMLPNPHWVKALRTQTGLDKAVCDFLEAQPMTEELFSDIQMYFDHWLPKYRQSNRSYMTIALGCTGGQHRSVYLANRLYLHYQTQFPDIQVRHRELQ